MDTALQTNVDAVISRLWTYFFGSLPTLKNSSDATMYVDPAQLLGYGGAGLSLLLSISGAYQVAAMMV